MTEPASTDASPVDTPPPPEIIEMFSDDDDLGLSFTSRVGDPQPTIRLLASDEWPDELAGGDSVDGVKIFELEPDGAVFAEPVRVTRRLDIEAFEALDLGPFDVPLVTMLTQDDAGEYSVLGDLTIVRVGPDLYVSGSTTHFSPIIVSNENRRVSWMPRENGFGPAPPIGETNLEPSDSSGAIAGVMAPPPGELIVSEGRYLDAEELYDYVHTVIEEQQLADEDHGEPAFGGYGLIDDDGMLIEGAPLNPEPVAPEDGAYRAERFGTSFPTIPAALLPSTSALTGDPTATIALAVWMPALVLTADALPVEPPADTAGEAQPDAKPVPTVVIGQDENGNDIVIEFEISEACAMTFHQPLDGDSLSFIRWVYDAPGLAPGTTISIENGEGFSQSTKVLDDRTIIVEQGISSYGDYRFPSVEWESGEGAISTISPDGSHTVDEREGEPSLTCLK